MQKSNRQKKLLESSSAVGIIVVAAVMIFLSLKAVYWNTPSGQNESFRIFTNELFCQEVSSNAVSLHYTLKNPADYGITKQPETFGSFEVTEKNVLASLENMNALLKKFQYKKLSKQNQLTYDILKYELENKKNEFIFSEYEEPLGIVSGIQSQLPVLLSEYQFYEKEDVEHYLKILQSMPEYFQSLEKFEKKKSQNGLFMSDDMADAVIEQCQAFLEMKEDNYLVTTFVERVKNINGLSLKEQGKYIEENAKMLNTYVYPEYLHLVAVLNNLKGTGNNIGGLCGLPKGKQYYEQIVRTETGSDQSVQEIRTMIKKQIVEDLQAMQKLLGEEEVQETIGTILNEEGQQQLELSKTSPTQILENLQMQIQKAFPKAPSTTVNVKYVPKNMEQQLSPAFYMIPAIDDYKDNTIYVNQAYMENELILFTTLAHEGYPGHLYQTTFFADTDPDPLRYTMDFGWYVEGWATYAEMCSYYLMQIPKRQAGLLQKNSSVLLGLYSLADIGIHYDGWSLKDTASFFENYGIRDENTVKKIYQLIVGEPGNYLKYYVGYIEFLELKKEAMQENKTFSQQKFHEQVLRVGPAPFEIVKKYMKILE